MSEICGRGGGLFLGGLIFWGDRGLLSEFYSIHLYKLIVTQCNYVLVEDK